MIEPEKPTLPNANTTEANNQSPRPMKNIVAVPRAPNARNVPSSRFFAPR